MCGLGEVSSSTCFNPHPARAGGVTEDALHLYNVFMRFNPHPARAGGVTPAGCRPSSQCKGFNPHPARAGGVTPVTDASTTDRQVSIRTPPARAG